MTKLMTLTMGTAALALTVGCSQMKFSPGAGNLTTGFAQSGSGAATIPPTDIVPPPNPVPEIPPTPGVVPPSPVGTGPDGEVCVTDDDDKDKCESGDDSKGMAVASASSSTSTDADSCKTEDGHDGHETGICELEGDDTSANRASLSSNPIVVQFVDITNRKRDVCLSKFACETLINNYLETTSGVLGGQQHSGDGGHYVNLSHHGACKKNNPNVMFFTDSQVQAAISQLTGP